LIRVEGIGMIRATRVLCWVLVAAIGVGFCMGCEGVKPKPEPPPTNGETESKFPDVDGEWRLKWENTVGGDKVNLTLTIEQDGEDLEITTDVGGLALDGEGEVESDGDITFKIAFRVNADISWTFEGEMDSKTEMSGEWEDTSASPLAPPYDEGTFTAFKIG